MSPSEKETRVLVVEDEIEIRELISLHLLRVGYRVTEVDSTEAAEIALQETSFDLVVLDWMLPGKSGPDFIREVRDDEARKNTPVLMVTAKAEPEDIVAGLESGADDYLTKPFEPAVLTARVKALLRRSEQQDQAKSEKIKLGGLELDFETYEVKYCGEPLHLTPSEFKLLGTLAMNQGRVLTRESLIEEIQGEGISVVGRTVDTHIFGLRKKLGACAEVIETIRGVGYRVRADV